MLNRNRIRQSGERPRQSGARPTVPPSVGLARPRQQVRTRVRRPPEVQEQALLPVEEGPPTFALSSDEDIQVYTSIL